MKKAFFTSFLVALIGCGLYLNALTPSSSGPWDIRQNQLADVAVEGGIYHLKNLRDYRYSSDDRVVEARFYRRDFDPNNLNRVWYGISHFAEHGLAHVFLSFEFNDGEYLAASVEARLRPGDSYSPLLGLVRRYTKIIVLGSERDIVGLRTHIRGERVLLYPLKLTTEKMHYLFDAVLRDAQQLQLRPDFYNTSLDNCLTNLFKHSPSYNPLKVLSDYRLILPGYSDQVAYDMGLLGDGDFYALQQRAQIPANIAEHINLNADSREFSRAIRAAMAGQPQVAGK